ncbi:hypothetical protein SCLARK_001397 [Spiroplasma clarkii]|uniref:Uncharacterized protein n=1 Tax=Spiroplasma clarkii TaxID=2139 RepID=A0A1Y0L1M9_9MOLU|nr:hypothetical protein [Spiroplasma clarkii]ARU91922.1 hypothetical protein SCLARK_001397 [Spiroplasma clarkii]ATX71266.1 hypothetical protein SCLAR_v1c09630 [Spiroplasma clarkii]
MKKTIIAMINYIDIEPEEKITFRTEVVNSRFDDTLRLDYDWFEKNLGSKEMKEVSNAVDFGRSSMNQYKFRSKSCKQRILEALEEERAKHRIEIEYYKEKILNLEETVKAQAILIEQLQEQVRELKLIVEEQQKIIEEQRIIIHEQRLTIQSLQQQLAAVKS